MSHFATYPEDLVKPCIMAGTSERGCCAECGAPWERVVQHTPMIFRHSEREKIKHEAGLVTALHGTLLRPAEHKTIGWRPTCECSEGKEPGAVSGSRRCIVLDPFAGSGTTIKVAQDLGRIGMGLELKADYIKMVRIRASQMGLMV